MNNLIQAYDRMGGFRITRYFAMVHNEVPHEVTVQPLKDPELLKLIVKHYNLTREDIIWKDDYYDTHKQAYHNESIHFTVRVREGVYADKSGPFVNIYYLKKKKKEVDKLVMFLSRFKGEPEKHFSLMTFTDSFSLENFPLKLQNTDLESCYNDDFLPVHHQIKYFLESEESGLVLLHGAPGTGKTSYIRHLISNCEKDFIFTPSEYLHRFSSPEFLPFISKNTDKVLILEDCERLIMDRKGSNFANEGISTLLNLSDGLLGDALRLKIICTFNADLKFLDSALLRKGRMKAKYEFKPLEVEKAQKLAAQKGIRKVFDKPVALSEIFNVEENGFVKKEVREMGFKVF